MTLDKQNDEHSFFNSILQQDFKEKKPKVSSFKSKLLRKRERPDAETVEEEVDQVTTVEGASANTVEFKKAKVARTRTRFHEQKLEAVEVDEEEQEQKLEEVQLALLKSEIKEK